MNYISTWVFPKHSTIQWSYSTQTSSVKTSMMLPDLRKCISHGWAQIVFTSLLISVKWLIYVNYMFIASSENLLPLFYLCLLSLAIANQIAKIKLK